MEETISESKDHSQGTFKIEYPANVVAQPLNPTTQKAEAGN